jgi:hypothetical protein
MLLFKQLFRQAVPRMRLRIPSRIRKIPRRKRIILYAFFILFYNKDYL